MSRPVTVLPYSQPLTKRTPLTLLCLKFTHSRASLHCCQPPQLKSTIPWRTVSSPPMHMYCVSEWIYGIYMHAVYTCMCAYVHMPTVVGLSNHSPFNLSTHKSKQINFAFNNFYFPNFQPFTSNFLRNLHFQRKCKRVLNRKQLKCSLHSRSVKQNKWNRSSVRCWSSAEERVCCDRTKP